MTTNDPASAGPKPDPGNKQPFPGYPDRPMMRRRLAVLTGAIALLVLAFALPLYELARFAASSELFSYIPLIPLVSLWLVWIDRGKFRPDPSPERRPAWIPLSIGLVLAVCGIGAGGQWAQADHLALMTLSFPLPVGRSDLDRPGIGDDAIAGISPGLSRFLHSASRSIAQCDRVFSPACFGRGRPMALLVIRHGVFQRRHGLPSARFHPAGGP